MGRFQFELATIEDDAELRAIIAATPMDGSVSISFRRDPSFFAAAKVEGDFHQVLVCRDIRAKRIAGFGCRSVRTMFVNGKPTQVGYLSGLRALPEYRSRGLVARAYAELRKLHDDGRTPFYLTTIAEGNEQALKILTSSRAGLPTYRFAGNYHTVVIPVPRRAKRPMARASLNVREATLFDRDKVLQFWAEVGQKRQFFPCYRANDLFGDSGLLRDFAPSDLLLAFRDNEIVGTLGGWKQQSFKQAVVQRYPSHLRWTRPIYNSWAALRGQPSLPRPGGLLRFLTASVPVAVDADPQIVGALLHRLLAQAVDCPVDFLTVGFHERDPLLPVADRLKVGCYVTRIYLVSWDDNEALSNQLDDRPLYLELGCL